MTDNATYTSVPGYEWPSAKRCINCRYWDMPHAIDGFATCYQLVYGQKWRLGTLEQVPEGDAAIIRTWCNFSCKYWEGRDESN